MRIDLPNALCENTYPGRGIIVGRPADARHAAIAYFIMGRSENSRNRIFEENETNGIRTRAYDESKLVDPSLIIYSPVHVLENHLIVTNGDQTDTIYDYIKDGKTFEEALRTRTFEPDPPNFTPRISGIATFAENDFSYKLSILKSNDGNGSSALRFFYEYAQPVAGEGHFIHTYQCDGNPIPSFDGEPEKVEIGNDLDAFTDMLWTSLNADNKVSLFTRFVNLETGEAATRIINKHQ